MASWKRRDGLYPQCLACSQVHRHCSVGGQWANCFGPLCKETLPPHWPSQEEMVFTDLGSKSKVEFMVHYVSDFLLECAKQVFWLRGLPGHLVSMSPFLREKLGLVKPIWKQIPWGLSSCPSGSSYSICISFLPQALFLRYSYMRGKTTQDRTWRQFCAKRKRAGLWWKAAFTMTAAIGDILSLDSNSIWWPCSFLVCECYDLLWICEEFNLQWENGLSYGFIPGIYFHLRWNSSQSFISHSFQKPWGLVGMKIKADVGKIQKGLFTAVWTGSCPRAVVIFHSGPSPCPSPTLFWIQHPHWTADKKRIHQISFENFYTVLISRKVCGWYCFNY